LLNNHAFSKEVRRQIGTVVVAPENQ